MKVALDYNHLVQKPQLCFPAVLSMVALRRGIWLDQEQIAEELKIRVTKDVSRAFSTKLGIAKNIHEAGYDIHNINLDRLNDLLQKHDVPARAQFFRISRIKDFKSFVEENMKKGNDIALLFMWKAFGFKAKFSHCALASSYDPKAEILEVCDPSSYKMKSFWRSKIDKFKTAMSKSWDKKERGCLVFISI